MRLLGAVGALVGIAMLTYGSNGKCPGFPVPVSSSAPPDYFGIGLDIGSVLFFGVVIYLLVKGRIQGGV